MSQLHFNRGLIEAPDWESHPPDPMLLVARALITIWYQEFCQYHSFKPDIPCDDYTLWLAFSDYVIETQGQAWGSEVITQSNHFLTVAENVKQTEYILQQLEASQEESIEERVHRSDQEHT